MEKSILITGCSSGIGQSAALILQERGYRVFATARKQEDVANLIQLGLTDSLLLDLTKPDTIKTALTTLLNRTNGTLYALFNNAGFVMPGAIDDLTREMMREQFEINVFGPMELINQVIPIMRQQGYGRIIQNSSLLGIVTMPYRGAYNASKFALEGFSNTLRQELRGTSILVSILVPGPIHSKLRENAFDVYKTTLKANATIHRSRYEQMEKYFFQPQEENRRLTLPPDAVVKKLIKALESPNPKAHYYIGFPAYLFAILRRLLPDKWLDWVVEKIIIAEGN